MSEEKQTCKATWDVLDLQDKNVMKFLAVGCWGVYCDEGNKTIIKKKKGECKSETVMRGQGTVSNIIDELIKKGFERSKFFSWEKCARETVEVYKKLMLD